MINPKIIYTIIGGSLLALFLKEKNANASTSIPTSESPTPSITPTSSSTITPVTALTEALINELEPAPAPAPAPPPAPAPAPAPAPSQTPLPISNSKTAIIEKAYQDIFGRAGDQSGIAYWKTQLINDSPVTVDNLGQSMINAAITKYGYSYDHNSGFYTKPPQET